MSANKFDKVTFDRLVAVVKARPSGATSRQAEQLADLLDVRVPRLKKCPFCEKKVYIKRYVMRKHLTQHCPFTMGAVEEESADAPAPVAPVVFCGKRKSASESEEETSEEDRSDASVDAAEVISSLGSPEHSNEIAESAPDDRVVPGEFSELKEMHRVFDSLVTEWQTNVQRSQVIQETATKLIDASASNEGFARRLLIDSANEARRVYSGAGVIEAYMSRVNAELSARFQLILCGPELNIPRFSRDSAGCKNSIIHEMAPVKNAATEELKNAFFESFWVTAHLRRRIEAVAFAKSKSIEALEFDQPFFAKRLFLSVFSLDCVVTASSNPAASSIESALPVSRSPVAVAAVGGIAEPSLENERRVRDGYFARYFNSVK